MNNALVDVIPFNSEKLWGVPADLFSINKAFPFPHSFADAIVSG